MICQQLDEIQGKSAHAENSNSDPQTGFTVSAVDVRFWHLADILSGSLNVRFQGQSGHRVTL